MLSNSSRPSGRWVIRKCQSKYFSAIISSVFKCLCKLSQPPEPAIPGGQPSYVPKKSHNKAIRSAISLTRMNFATQASPDSPANFGAHFGILHGPANEGDANPITYTSRRFPSANWSRKAASDHLPATLFRNAFSPPYCARRAWPF